MMKKFLYIYTWFVVQVYARSKSGAMLDLVDGSSLLYRLQLEGNCS